MTVATTVQAEELAAWIRLDQTVGVGPAIARRLLGSIGLPQEIFAAAFGTLSKVVPEQLARALLSPPDARLQELIARTQEWVAQPGNAVVTLADSAYPASLLEIPDPPVMLYAKGRLALLQAHAIAIVGSRHATGEGLGNAERFGAALSEVGLTVVSGLALGIDAAAHQGGLRGIGSTVAVIGTGADLVYPARNRDLAHRIAAEGCIVSEFPLGTAAAEGNFPRRNRIISGLSKGTLVVEAAVRSGTLITARMALEQGRDVFAIPGSIHSPVARGCHQLIRQGAKLVESATDILEELRWQPDGHN